MNRKLDQYSSLRHLLDLTTSRKEQRKRLQQRLLHCHQETVETSNPYSNLAADWSSHLEGNASPTLAASFGLIPESDWHQMSLDDDCLNSKFDPTADFDSIAKEGLTSKVSLTSRVSLTSDLDLIPQIALTSSSTLFPNSSYEARQKKVSKVAVTRTHPLEARDMFHTEKLNIPAPASAAPLFNFREEINRVITRRSKLKRILTEGIDLQVNPRENSAAGQAGQLVGWPGQKRTINEQPVEVPSLERTCPEGKSSNQPSNDQNPIELPLLMKTHEWLTDVQSDHVQLTSKISLVEEVQIREVLAKILQADALRHGISLKES